MTVEHHQKLHHSVHEFTSRFRLKDSESRLQRLTNEKGVPANISDQAWYEMAVSQVLQQHLDQATKTINAFGKQQNKGEAYERSRLLLAQIYMQQGNLLAAANEFRAFKTQFPNSALISSVDMFLPGIERQLSAKKQ